MGRFRIAGLVLLSPAVAMAVALPVGFVMEIGKQRTLTIANPGTGPVEVTLIGVDRDGRERVAPLTLHPLLPLPALRAAALPMEPCSTRALLYSARQVVPTHLHVVAPGAPPWSQPLPSPMHGVMIPILGPGPPGPEAAAHAALAAGRPQLLPWSVLLGTLLGVSGFFACLRRPS